MLVFMTIDANFGRVSQGTRHFWHRLPHLTDFMMRLLGAESVFL